MQPETESKEIEVGNAVTVICPELIFTGKQGVVVEIVDDNNEDGPIGVQFPYWTEDLFRRDFPEETVVRFKSDDLQIDPALNPVPVKKLLRKLFGPHFAVWQVLSSRKPFIPGVTKCMHDDCARPAWFEIYVNIHGTVSKYCACGEHTSLHGVISDGVPFHVK